MTGILALTGLFILAAIGLYQVVMHTAESIVNFLLGVGRMFVYPIVWACNGRETAECIRKDHKPWEIDLKN